MKLALISALAVSLVATACPGRANDVSNKQDPTTTARDRSAESLTTSINAIEPFFQPMAKPGEFDWLAVNNEPGQAFEEYIDSGPTMPTGDRRTIYIQPLGKFTAEQARIIKTASEYIEAFYGLPAKSLSPKSIPKALSIRDERMIDYPKHRQVRSGYILEKMLQPVLPNDAAALIAFTNEDLYPDTSMYFVFGQASLENRVGVWSLYRLDDQANYETFLKRTLKISVHETGHMFSMRHCTKYECVMSGTNHLGETDRRPIDACPECMAKICWMTKQEPSERYKRLQEFAKRNGLPKDVDEFRRKAEALQ